MKFYACVGINRNGKLFKIIVEAENIKKAYENIQKYRLVKYRCVDTGIVID